MTEYLTIKILLISSNPKVSKEPVTASYPSRDDDKATGGPSEPASYPSAKASREQTANHQENNLN